jgi:hypothetical protein
VTEKIELPTRLLAPGALRDFARLKRSV